MLTRSSFPYHLPAQGYVSSKWVRPHLGTRILDMSIPLLAERSGFGGLRFFSGPSDKISEFTPWGTPEVAFRRSAREKDTR